jgi:hypothetical protein
VDVKRIAVRVEALRAKYAGRDRRAAEVRLVRAGEFEKIAPDLFSDEWPRPVIANIVENAARDFASVLAPLPAFSCSSSSMLAESARKSADKLTKIVNIYPEFSRLQVQMLGGADQYNSYGMLVTSVQPDFDHKMPFIHVESALGAYPVLNARGDVTEFARVVYRDWFDLCADYPELSLMDRSKHPGAMLGNRVQVVKWSDRERTVCYLPDFKNYVFDEFENPLGECPYVVSQRPSLDGETVYGAYDDTAWVMLAAHRLQMLTLQGVDDAVNAPLVVPMDVGDVPMGPGAVIHTSAGATAVGRARLDMPPQAFNAAELLKEETRRSAGSPEARSGSIDASVITGRGVQQLMAGWDTQISAAQLMFTDHFSRVLGKCLTMDEQFWADEDKTVRGNDNGVPYEVKYRPSRDIAGRRDVDVSYGFTAGLTPNQALVYLLQVDGAGIVSKDLVRRSLPVAVNASEEEKKIQVEQLRGSLVEAMAATAQAIPQMAAQGMDPAEILGKSAAVVQGLSKGRSIEDVMQKVFAPPKAAEAAPEAPVAPGEAEAQAGAGGAAEELMSALGGGQSGGYSPELRMLFAGADQSGAPSIRSGVSRRVPVNG